jgi:hypothetical protein
MVKTVSTPGLVPPWTEALAIWAPGSADREIQSSGMTKRAKTLPLSPEPFSPDGE